MCLRIPNISCPIVAVVNKHLCVVVNIVITWKCQSLNVWKKTDDHFKFCANIGKTPTDTYKELKRASGTSSVSRRLVFMAQTLCRRERVGRRWQPVRQTSLRNAGACNKGCPIYSCTGGTCTLHKNNKNYTILCINHPSIDSKTNYNIKANATLQATNNEYNYSDELT
jgi:hypothetical protein